MAVQCSEEMAARRLAAIGDKFLMAFDDVDSDSEMAEQHSDFTQPTTVVERMRTPQGNSSSDLDSSAIHSDSDGSGNDYADNEAAVAAPVFEFTSSGVHQQGHRGTAAAFVSQEGRLKRRRVLQSAAASSRRQDPAEGLTTWTGSRSEILDLHREVQTYGAAALDKKSKKQFETKELAKLGARPDKAPRLAAAIGKGLKKKQDSRALKAQEEAIEAGHISRRAIAKMRRRAKDVTRKPTKGLGEDNGAFRGGVLRVGSDMKMKKSGRRR